MAIQTKTPEAIEPYKWKKGQCGNPNGRPKKLPVMRDIVAEILNDPINGKTTAEAILRAVAKQALKGDLRSAEFLFFYAYGKPTQKIENVGEPTEIRIIRE